MKSHHFSSGGHGKGPTHKSHMRQHHKGHPHGHPTEHGTSKMDQLPLVGTGAPDYGSMAEHGLSEGNVHAVKAALPETQPNASVLTEHGLQHVSFPDLTGHNFVHPSRMEPSGGPRRET